MIGFIFVLFWIGLFLDFKDGLHILSLAITPILLLLTAISILTTAGNLYWVNQDKFQIRKSLLIIVAGVISIPIYLMVFLATSLYCPWVFLSVLFQKVKNPSFKFSMEFRDFSNEVKTYEYNPRDFFDLKCGLFLWNSLYLAEKNILLITEKQEES